MASRFRRSAPSATCPMGLTESSENSVWTWKSASMAVSLAALRGGGGVTGPGVPDQSRVSGGGVGTRAIRPGRVPGGALQSSGKPPPPATAPGRENAACGPSRTALRPQPRNRPRPEPVPGAPSLQHGSHPGPRPHPDGQSLQRGDRSIWHGFRTGGPFNKAAVAACSRFRTASAPEPPHAAAPSNKKGGKGRQCEVGTGAVATGALAKAGEGRMHR